MASGAVRRPSWANVLSCLLFVTLCIGGGILASKGPFEPREVRRLLGDEGEAASMPAVVEGGIENELATVSTTTNPNCHLMYGRCLPTFFIAGAFKAGTTSMYKYISLHPNVKVRLQDDPTVRDPSTKLVVRVKEVGFFNSPIKKAPVKGNGIAIVDGEAQQGQKLPERVARMRERARQVASTRRGMWSYHQYLQVFPDIKPEDNLITGEGTPNYLPSIHSAGLIASQLPWARVIILMREPIYRGYSRMSHLHGMMCTRRNSPICNANELVSIFDTIIAKELPGFKKCTEEHWPLDPVELERVQSNVDLVHDHYSRLSVCVRANINKANQAFRAPRNPAQEGQQTNEERSRRAVQGARNSFLMQSLSRMILFHSLYAPSVAHFHAFMPAEQILVLISEDMFTRPLEVMQQVEQHLSLPTIDWAPIVGKKYNVGFEDKTQKDAGFLKEAAVETKHEVTPATRAQLERFFDPYNRQVVPFVDREVEHGTPWVYENL